MKLEKPSRFQAALLFSLAFHALLWQALSWRHEFFRREAASSMEIDLTRPFRLTPDPKLARRSSSPGMGAPLAKTPAPAPDKPADVKPVPREWVLPGPKTEEPEKPKPEEMPPAGLGGAGEGIGSGEVDLIHLTELPKILNREDVAEALRRFYPRAEQEAGREGDVFLNVHIDADGRVTGLDIVRSAGPAFDAAARKVLSVARFSPAKVKDKSVPVKIGQTVAFRLEN